LNHLIHAVYGVDSPGSKAQKIAFARDRFVTNTGQESVFVVGDSLSDILAAKEASVTSIAITWDIKAWRIYFGGILILWSIHLVSLLMLLSNRT
jgi:phosphoglycolate phosphatase-like HAD superfamily hydrolase